MIKRLICGLMAGVMMLVAGCGGQKAAETPGTSGTDTSSASSTEASEVASAPQDAEKAGLMVSAAASLTDCMEELKTLYTTEHPEITITYNFGASGSLQQQIEQGAPADIFFSAGKKQMDALKEKGLMEDASIRDILENKVVLIAPKEGSLLDSFDALTGTEVEQIGVGEPESVPVGQYTAQIFENLGLAETLKPKLVLAKDVREVLSWVETGNVQAGVVYETDAKISDKVQICCAAPEGSHKPVIYPVGVVKDSKYTEQAQAFVDFLFTEQAQKIFAKYGFSPV